MKNDQMYLHPEVETLSRPDIEKLQLKRLKATIDRCMHSPFYKERFQQCGIKPEDIQSLEDLQKIPFTTKQDLRDHYPFGLSAVPLEEVVRLHSSSGTTGTPTVILHTQHDLEEWAVCIWWDCVKEISSKTLLATVCLPVAWVSSMVPNVWVC